MDMLGTDLVGMFLTTYHLAWVHPLVERFAKGPGPREAPLVQDQGILLPVSLSIHVLILEFPRRPSTARQHTGWTHSI